MHMSLQPTKPGPSAPESFTSAVPDATNYPMFEQQPFYECSQAADEQVGPEVRWCPSSEATQPWFSNVPLTPIGIDSPTYMAYELASTEHPARRPNLDTFVFLGAVSQANFLMHNEAPFLPDAIVQDTHETLAMDASLTSDLNGDKLPVTRSDYNQVHRVRR